MKHASMFLQFQVVDNIEDGDLIRLTVLAVELIASVLLSVATLSKSVRLAGSRVNNDNSLVMPSEAIASLVIFSIMGAVYVAIAAAHFVCLWRKKSPVQHICPENAARNVLTAIGGIFYYIGDNLPPLVEEYAEDLRCPECVERTQVAGLVMLAIAITTYLPIVINAVLPHNKDKEEVNTPACIAVFLLLAKITDLDLVYTVVERIIPRTCDETIVGGTWAHYIFYIIVFLVVTLCAAICLCRCEENKSRQIRMWTVVNAFLVCTFMAFYILADNRLPLGCSGSVRDNRLVRDGLKVALLSISLIIAIYSVTVFGVWRYRERKQK